MPDPSQSPGPAPPSSYVSPSPSASPNGNRRRSMIPHRSTSGSNLRHAFGAAATMSNETAAPSPSPLSPASAPRTPPSPSTPSGRPSAGGALGSAAQVAGGSGRLTPSSLPPPHRPRPASAYAMSGLAQTSFASRPQSPASTATPTALAAPSSPRRSRVTASSSASTASGDVDLDDIGHVHVVLRIRPAVVGGGGEASSVPARWQRTVLRPSPFRPDKEVLVQSEVQAGSGAESARASISSMSALTSLPSVSTASKTTTYAFDRVLGEQSTQAECYEVLGRKAVERFVQGVNVTILAYGQTSSGKSYSMGTTGLESDYADVGGSASDGYADRIGIIPRAVGDLFARVEEEARHAGPSANWECRLTFLELYNEELIDLLAPAGVASVPIQIREDKGRIIWAGLREVRVQSVDDVMRHLRAGSERRRTGETAMNADSSRSHAIFSLTLTQRRSGSSISSSSRPASVAGYHSSTPTNVSRRSSVVATAPEAISLVSKFHFVDLAGSERLKRTGAVQERMKEGISINSGLTALGNVIQALADHKHVPYRDSKLTRLLQDSLGGNSYTIMLACVSPVEYNLSETHSTLRYGSRARSIKNRAQVNATEVGWDDLEHLQTLVLKLRAELADSRARPASAPTSEEGDGASEDVQALRSRLEETRSELQEATVHSTRLASELERARTAVVPSDSDQPFNVLVEPIIAEYERTVSALEDEIKRLKDAWYMCNELNHQQEVDLQTKEVKLGKQDEYITELRVRIDKLLDSEKTSEEHIGRLEAQLKEAQDAEASSKEKFAEAQKEQHTLASKQDGQKAYITELESKMNESQLKIAELQTTVARAEQDAEHRKAELDVLKERLASLEDEQKTRQPLEELDSKNVRLAEVKRELDESIARLAEMSSDREDLRAQLKAHKEETSTQLATALADLDAMTRKYQESLQEVAALSKDVEGSRLDDEGSDPEETLTSEEASPKRIVHRRHRSDGGDSALSIKTREEDFWSGKRRGSQVVTTSKPLSEELSSSLVSPSFSAGGRSLLSPSPVFWRQSLPPAPNQRSAQSLETEIKQFQEALKVRDEEIAELEASLRDLHGVSSRPIPAVPNSDEHAEDPHDTSADDEAIITPSASPSRSPRVPLSHPPELHAFTPSTKRHYDTLRESLAAEPNIDEEDSLRRLDHLMRSMARKETAHKEHVEAMAAKIDALQHENEHLQAKVPPTKYSRESGSQTIASESCDRAVATVATETSDTGCGPVHYAPIDDGSVARAMFERLQRHASAQSSEQDDRVVQLETAFQSLQAEHTALQLKIKQMEARPAMSRARSGTESMASFRAGMQIVAEAASSDQPIQSDPSSPATRHTFARSATPTSKYPPPMSPPPNMPPPPVPTALPSLPGQTESKRGSGSLSVCTDSPAVDDDSARPAKLLVQMQEQEPQIQLLKKRLEAAEQASTDHAELVRRLNENLNASDKSLRKMRMQMQENSREKQAAQAEADDLRAELDQIRSEMTQVRRSVIVEKQSLEDKLSEERIAKERARAQLEERLNAAMQKKSKFQCF